MRSALRLPAFTLLMASSVCGFASARPSSSAKANTAEACPRPAAGSEVLQPADLRSKNGVLSVALAFRSSTEADGRRRYCYVDGQGHPAPTLRLQPGDTLVLRLKNEIAISPASTHAAMNKSSKAAVHDPCAGGEMSASSTNLHFHGLSVPPVCHQDETLKTLIEPGDPPFEYRLQIPKDQPPGLYWYHPHVHGFAEEQILGGASGALIVEGMEHAVPRVAGLPERVLVIRDERMPPAPPSEKPDPAKPTKQLSINYIPVPYPDYQTAIIKMKPGEKQFWRVLNASADTYIDLGFEVGGQRQSFNLVALDGVPLHYGDPGSETYSPQTTNLFLPPAGRAEFIITAPAEGTVARLITHGVYRGAGDDNGPVLPRSALPPAVRAGQDDVDPSRPLASIVASAKANAESVSEPIAVAALQKPAPGLSSVRPMRARKLFFSEKLKDPQDPKSATDFFITEDGKTPTVFDPHSSQPTLTVHQGDVEDWTIENRSMESHTFHVHQLHFIVVGSRSVGWSEPTPRDTINIPAWSGIGLYPSVTVRMDFRDPRIVGLFPFHCHIVQHIDGGMMGTILVEPAAGKTQKP